MPHKKPRRKPSIAVRAVPEEPSAEEKKNFILSLSDLDVPQGLDPPEPTLKKQRFQGLFPEGTLQAIRHAATDRKTNVSAILIEAAQNWLKANGIEY